MRAAAVVVVCAAGAVCTAASAAHPVQGSVAGPVTSVRGSTFSLKTPLSPTGSSKVTVTAKTTITKQVSGTRADLAKGTCVMAAGTKKGRAVAATRITVIGRQCANGFRRGNSPPRRQGGGTRPPQGRRFTPPANFAFAFGTIQKVSGSTLTLKGFQGTTSVVVWSKTEIGKTARVKRSAIAAKECAFVRGTSADKGITVLAADVSLSDPVHGSCNRLAGRP